MANNLSQDEIDRALDAIERRESAGKNVYNYKYHLNPNYYTASGYYQIVNSTWREGAKMAGVDTKEYPTAIDAPRDVQKEVAKAIYRRYGPEPWAQSDPNSPKFEGRRNYNFTGLKFKPSDFAMSEYEGKRNTDVVGMDPAVYLALSPEMEEEPFSSRKGKSLLRSVERGDEIDSLPTLDIDRNGKVTDQDGRHRALLAQQDDVDVLPVAMRYQRPVSRETQRPSQLTGMRGDSVPNAFQPMRKLREAIVPSAEAAEIPDDIQWNQPQQAQKPSDGLPDDIIWNQPQAAPPTQPVQPPQAVPQVAVARPAAPAPAAAATIAPAPSPPNMALSALEGAGAGFGRTVLGGEQLLGRGLSAIGLPNLGQALQSDAERGVASIGREIAPAEAAHPIATGVGEFAGSTIPAAGIGRAAAMIPLNRLGTAAATGAISSVLQPEKPGDPEYWRKKAAEAGVGAALGAGTDYVLGRFLMPPAMRTRGGQTKENPVSLLSREGVQLTPGQVAGGEAKWAENALSSVPVAGAELRNAQRRSIETFNAAAINRSLEDIGVRLPNGLRSGREAISWAKAEFDKAYDMVLPYMTARLDPIVDQKLSDTLTKAQRELARDPTLFNQVKHFIDNRVRPELRAGIDGREYKRRIEEELDTLVRRYYPQGGMERSTAGFFKEIDEALESALERQNPAFAAQKKIIDRGYYKYKVVEKASSGPVLEGHDPGTFTPAQLSMAVRDFGTGGRPAYARGTRVLQDLSDAGSQVLPPAVPRSGTPERLFWPALLSQGWKWSPEATAAAAGLTAAYTPAGMASYNWILRRLAEQPTGATNNLREALRSLAPSVVGRVGGEFLSGQ